MAALRPGDLAPDFTRTTQGGETITLSRLRGDKAVVVYFYPKDETAGCTAEACRFRDLYEDFVDAGATVIGISRDSDDSHRAFASHHRLPFHLLSDRDGSLAKLFGVKKTLGLLPGRETFVIDKEGRVRHVFRSQVLATKHVTEALEVVKAL